LNYFNYFTEIEDAFVRRRARHLLLSPLDWALIESWKEMDVPLHVALRGIEKAFDSWESKPRKRSINSLVYCQEEVEAQFAEWRESRVGAADQSNETKNGERDTHNSDSLPFSRAAILEHLRRGRASLLEVCARRKKLKGDDFSDALERATSLLLDLEQELEETSPLEAQKLEQSISGVERLLSDASRSAASSEQMAAFEQEVKKQLKPYRKHMDVSVYQQTFDNLLLKKLREHFGVPRLSLFYL
jgi:hypothetical protein